MPDQITAYRIFIASPGGLEDERTAFRRIIESHNDSDAIERGVIFRPIGWEDIPGGVGRPQHLINEDVRRSDYFVLVLWDRWGSPPQVDEHGEYKSGSEEEFGVAQTCHKAGTMQNIVILFKDVDPEKLRDPGPQLQAVLEFRKRLETDKRFYFETFDGPSAFEERLRRHLFGWVRNHEQGTTGPVSPSATGAAMTPIEMPLSGGSGPSADAVQGAEELAKEGRLVAAEEALAQVLPEADFDALNQYGAVLVEKGSLESAEEIFTRLHGLAEQQEQPEWVVSSLNNLATIYIAQGRLDEAESRLAQALEIREATLGPDHVDVAASLKRLAELEMSQRRFDEAEQLLRRALAIQGVHVDE